jgi:hypothetical protein
MGVAVGSATHPASAAAIVYEELPQVSAKGKPEPYRNGGTIRREPSHSVWRSRPAPRGW